MKAKLLLVGVLAVLVAGCGGGGGGSSQPSHPTPTITSITPNNGPKSGGTGITIVGSGFKTNAFSTGVTVGGVNATNITVNSDSNLVCKVPGGTGTVDVQVVVEYLTAPVTTGKSALTDADKFTYN